MQISQTRFILGILLAISVLSCRKTVVDTGGSGTSADTLKYNPDWTFASHGNSAPDYATAFPQDALNSMEIVMTADQWTSIKANMKTLTGIDFGMNTGGPPPASSSTDPAYMDVTLRFRGKTWKNVGFRLKGNSTLRMGWQQGNYKLPFRLNFDEFEDKYPGTTNQHFHGFEELSFSPGAKDPSLIREKVTADIFRMAGIPAARTALYRVSIDFGAGLKYCGVYTCVELPDDNMIKSQFGEESGNIYKPELNLTSFNALLFDKKNNETAANFSDAQQLVSILNSPLRTSNPAQWKAQLQAIFDVDHFLKYLAVNNAIVNWDSYGVMAHNFYLYNHSTRKFVWIPWDHNEAMSGSPGITGTTGGGGGGMPPGRNALSLSMNEVTASWPLIRYIIDDPAWLQAYKDHMKTFRNNVFTEAAMQAMIDKYHGLVAPHAVGANGEQPGYTYLTSAAAFTAELASLKSHVTARRALVASYVP